ncbi:hypothetical protein L6452_08928 [Arctium lappa]|uniref:Uncharacterized protein n=1 Tax=Arctium lappa TaxID=4217 RepID=A0ACB9DIM5_ARCLA|nr:hypothetical protein L6452_08928 [Arctium lappa]
MVVVGLTTTIILGFHDLVLDVWFRTRILSLELRIGFLGSKGVGSRQWMKLEWLKLDNKKRYSGWNTVMGLGRSRRGFQSSTGDGIWSDSSFIIVLRSLDCISFCIWNGQPWGGIQNDGSP